MISGYEVRPVFLEAKYRPRPRVLEKTAGYYYTYAHERSSHACKPLRICKMQMCKIPKKPIKSKKRLSIRFKEKRTLHTVRVYVINKTK